MEEFSTINKQWWASSKGFLTENSTKIILFFLGMIAKSLYNFVAEAIKNKISNKIKKIELFFKFKDKKNHKAIELSKKEIGLPLDLTIINKLNLPIQDFRLWVITSKHFNINFKLDGWDMSQIKSFEGTDYNITCLYMAQNLYPNYPIDFAINSWQFTLEVDSLGRVLKNQNLKIYYYFNHQYGTSPINIGESILDKKNPEIIKILDKLDYKLEITIKKDELE